MGAVTPNPATTVFNAGDSLAISGTVATGAGDPPGSLALLAYFTQASVAKWTRFGSALCGFTKVSVPGGGGQAAFSLAVRVADFMAYEPDTGGYEVMSGVYKVSLGTSVDTAGLYGSVEVTVNGTYSWVWDFSK